MLNILAYLVLHNKFIEVMLGIEHRASDLVVMQLGTCPCPLEPSSADTQVQHRIRCRVPNLLHHCLLLSTTSIVSSLSTADVFSSIPTGLRYCLRT